MARVNRMVGVPWHVERLERQEDDPRRHRTRCQYYNKLHKSCRKRNGRCIGSAHCMEYEEAEAEDIPVVTQEEKRRVPEGKAFDEYKKIGIRVQHKKYGTGEIVEVDDRNMTILFDNGYQSKFAIQSCVDNGIVKRI